MTDNNSLHTKKMYNPQQKFLAHLGQIAGRYVDKVFWGQYLMVPLE